MRTDIISSSCPVVDHERGTFARIIDVSGGRGIYEVVAFESDVAWLRDTEYTLALYNAEGRLLKEGGTYGDFRSYLSAYIDPFRMAPRFADEYGVTQGGHNVVEVRMSVIERPVYEVDDHRFSSHSKSYVSSHSKSYRAIPSGWLRANDPGIELWRAACARGEIFTELKIIEKRTVFEAVIWSSRLGIATSAQVPALQAAIERGLVGVSDELARDVRGRLDLFVSNKLAA